MADVDIIATSFNKLDDMVSELCLHHFRNLSVFKGEGGGFKLWCELSTAIESEFSAFLCRAWVFRVQECQGGEAFTFQDTCAQPVKPVLHREFLVKRDRRLLHNLRNLVLCAHHRDRVLRNATVELAHIGR